MANFIANNKHLQLFPLKTKQTFLLRELRTEREWERELMCAYVCESVIP